MTNDLKKEITAASLIRTFIGLILAATLVLAHPTESRGAESIFGFSFKDVAAPSSTTDKSFRTGKEAAFRDDYIKMASSAQDVTGKSTDSAWNEIDYRNFRLSFSTLLAEPSLDKNYRRLTPENSPDIGQMFPLIFQGSYRDSMQTLGKMMEPQIRIEIRF